MKKMYIYLNLDYVKVMFIKLHPRMVTNPRPPTHEFCTLPTTLHQIFCMHRKMSLVVEDTLEG